MDFLHLENVGVLFRVEFERKEYAIFQLHWKLLTPFNQTLRSTLCDLLHLICRIPLYSCPFCKKIKTNSILLLTFYTSWLGIRPRKIDSEKSVTFEKTECATRVLYFISRIFQMKCATDVNNFFRYFLCRVSSLTPYPHNFAVFYTRH